MAEENKELTQQELSEQNRIRREKLAQMQEAGKDPFQIVKYDVTHHSDEIRANFDVLENKDVCIAGRLMSKRIMGKASSARRITLHSKNMTSVISSASRALYSKQKQAKFPYTQKRLFCFPRACRFCPKSSMV